MGLESRRQRLAKRIRLFQKKAEKFMGAQDDDDLEDQYDGAEWDHLEVGYEADHDEDDAEEVRFFSDGGPMPDQGPSVPPEKENLNMPSNVGAAAGRERGLEALMAEEIELRCGQANDALQKIRIALGYKSVLYRTSVRQATSQRMKLRAFDEVHSVEKTVQQNTRIYALARKALVALEAKPGLLEKYKVLKREDLKVSSALIEANTRGLRNTSLSWIWAQDVARDAQGSEWMTECKPGSRQMLIRCANGRRSTSELAERKGAI